MGNKQKIRRFNCLSTKLWVTEVSNLSSKITEVSVFLTVGRQHCQHTQEQCVSELLANSHFIKSRILGLAKWDKICPIFAIHLKLRPILI